VKCSVKTSTGNITSEWRREDGRIKLKVALPSCVEARIILPYSDSYGKREYVRRVAGEWIFTMNFAGPDNADTALGAIEMEAMSASWQTAPLIRKTIE
jgi:hypothetical protein